MIYRLPTLEDEILLREYVREHHENGENSITASHGLLRLSYPEWVMRMNQNATIGDENLGRFSCLLCMDGENLIGLLSIRCELTEELSAKYGHIGYGVRPSERSKGYATAMLQYALTVCKENGLQEVLLGCYKDNVASAKTIQKCGGILVAENDNYTEGRLSQYYLVGEEAAMMKVTS